MARTCTVIVNPASGGYRPALGDTIVALLQGAGQKAVLRQTRAAGDASVLAKEAAAADDALIVVCGGDGTVGEVINGIGSGAATLAVLPVGTANVLALELGIDSIEKGLAALVAGVSRPLALGSAATASEKRRFSLMAGIGFDGRVVAAVRPQEKRRFGKGAYLLAALRCLYHWEITPLAVTLDGRSIACHGLIVCNASRYGGAFQLARRADPFTSGFEVVCIHGPRRRDYLRLGLAVALGRAEKCRGISVLSAARVCVAGVAAIQLDGDAWLKTPAIFTAESGGLRIIIAAEKSTSAS